MDKSKQIEALRIVDSAGYVFKEDKIYSKNGKELFVYGLPSNYIQCRIRHKGNSLIVYKHILIYLYHFGCYPDGLVIAHKDCNCKNNHPSNLVAVTQSENLKMSTSNRKGLVLKRLTQEQKTNIVLLSSKGLSQSEISRKLSINRTVVRYTIKVSGS